MLISVILCNYNYGRFIGEAIESVLNQTYKNFELIIVDDGSTDNSRDVINRYAENDKRIKTIFKENAGQASAFNAGFEIAKGEIISFLDSDDFWREDKLNEVVKWDRFLEGNYSVLQHSLLVFTKNNKYLYKNVLLVGDCFKETQETGNINFFVPTSGLSFRKNILNNVFPIPEKEFKIAADAYIMRTAYCFGLVFSIPFELGYYREHNNEVFKNDSFDAKEFFLLLYKNLNNFYSKNGFQYQFKYAENESINKIRFFRKLIRIIKFIRNEFRRK